ncbi:MAG: hypothetical protein JNM94_07515 [Phycisphaerae bacterium]|nr:hypothetical protein [Phycisphaerae bacterium]
MIAPRLALALAAAVGVAAATLGQSSPPATTSEPPPRAKTLFFEALQRAPERRADAIRALGANACSSDAADSDLLLLGLAHLWKAADGSTHGIDRHSNAVIAEHWLRRARERDPGDTRIPGWIASARVVIATDEGRDDDRRAAIDELAKLSDADPCFHAVPLSIASFSAPRGSAEFTQALKAMNAAFDCGRERGAGDGPRWPHNVHGFLVGLADMRLKAGDRAGAEAALTIAEARTGSETWRYRGEIEKRFAELDERLRRYGNDDPTDDPPYFLGAGGASCLACHAVDPK